jgi:hypothetical protein
MTYCGIGSLQMLQHLLVDLIWGQLHPSRGVSLVILRPNEIRKILPSLDNGLLRLFVEC